MRTATNDHANVTIVVPAPVEATPAESVQGHTIVKQESEAPEVAAASWPNSKWPPLLNAVMECDEVLTQELLEARADVNCSGALQKTPIYYAIQFNNAELVRRLLQQPGIDIHKQMRSAHK